MWIDGHCWRQHRGAGDRITRSGKRNELDEKLAANDQVDNLNIHSGKCVIFIPWLYMMPFL